MAALAKRVRSEGEPRSQSSSGSVESTPFDLEFPGALHDGANGNPSAAPLKVLRVLMVEDSAFDEELVVHALRRGGYRVECERVQTADELRAALKRGGWDVVLADYNLPQFSAPEALRILQESRLDLPFIVVSGTIGESTAVAAMKAGAHDYLMKENLVRLVPVVERELREAANRAARREAKAALRQSELRYKLLWETATDAIIMIDTESRIHFANPAVEGVFGYKPEELIGKSLTMLQPEHLRARHRQGVQHYLRTGEKRLNWRAVETVGLKKDGTEFPIEVAFSDMEIDGQRWFVGFVRDVTERKRAERELAEGQEQFRVAREIQQHLFPSEPPELSGFDVAGASCPAEATGGDYFDYFPMRDGKVGFVVGDVTGHGVGPALLMAEARAYLRILAKVHSDVGEILTRANEVLAEDVGTERFVTLLFAQIDPAAKSLTYANAGHPSGYVLSGSGQVKRLLSRTGVPLGIRRQTGYRPVDPVALVSGDIVLFLTDGFEEAVSPEDVPFGIERILEVVRQNQTYAAHRIVRALYESLTRFTKGTPQEDDLTVIVVKVL